MVGLLTLNQIIQVQTIKIKRNRGVGLLLSETGSGCDPVAINYLDACHVPSPCFIKIGNSDNRVSIYKEKR